MKSILVESFFSSASGVVDEIIGKQKSCCVFDSDDCLGLVGYVLYEISQGSDVRVMQYYDEEEV